MCIRDRTGLKRARRVHDQSYDRDAVQEEWVNSRPFDRSGNILKAQSRPVRAKVMRRWISLVLSTQLSEYE
eukprot:5706301-Alexandrium_andersonii.AAC.1